jgi:uncharacterized protein (DUF58 family)
MFDWIAAWVRKRRPLWAIYPTPHFAKVAFATALLWLVPGGTGFWLATAGLVGLAGAAVVDYARLPRRRSITVARTAAPVVGLGDDETLEYAVASNWPRAFRVLIRDAIPASIEADSPRDVLSIPGGETLTVNIPFVANERGRFQLGALALRATTGLGFVQRIARFELEDELVVVPSISNVRRFRLLALQNRLSDVGVRALKQRGEGGAFAGLRDYVPGDDPRMVDWKATARHSRLITREQTVERAQTVISMIDCGRAMTQSAGTYSRFEHVLSAALVLSDVAATSGDRAGLIAFDDKVRAFVPPQRGTAGLRSLRVALSGLDATMTEPDYASAFRLLATRQPRRALVVLFTDVIDARVVRSFISYADRATKRHVLVVVAIQNEALLAAARPSTRGSLALYRSAAAEELIREREEALIRMRRAGISVLDVAPGRMAVAVVNRYLDIKSRGLL